MEQHQVDIFKKCLSTIHIKEIQDRIGNFKRTVDPRTISEDRLKQELSRLFYVNFRGKEATFFLKTDTYTHEHQKFFFYRIRKLKNEDVQNIYTKNFESIRNESDVWETPESKIKVRGRLNDVNQSVLYASSELSNAMYETNCVEGDYFFVIVYKNVGQMRVSQIHIDNHFPEFDELENAKIAMMSNFLREEFTRYVPQGQEYKYRISHAIYKQFFCSNDVDAFTYPSVKSLHTTGYNICFEKSKSRKNLRFLGVMVCRASKQNAKSEFNLEIYYDGFLNDSGTFDFYSPNSEISRKKFGNFTLVRDMGL
ncbi:MULTISPECIES: RES domain-containing protein [Olivibacter]|uniref:RES domain-containing protein n=1 Tax=Olivibacter jilunii TaxID=985016 RepID=A0ABW6B7X2_9SPHI|nr:RES domain-containing protein [Pseudosphingobacterium sp.]